MAKRILITDDALFMRVTLKNILTKNGYEIAGEAANGREAVELYRSVKPDAVTMDITMSRTIEMSYLALAVCPRFRTGGAHDCIEYTK